MTKKKSKNVIYTGGGFGGSFTGIPARDLTAEEVEEAGGLDLVLSTGLYCLPEDDEDPPEEINEES